MSEDARKTSACTLSLRSILRGSLRVGPGPGPSPKPGHFFADLLNPPFNPLANTPLPHPSPPPPTG